VIKKRDLSKEDKKTWEDYIKDPSDIFDKDKNISKVDIGKERYKFDLHGYNLDNANNKVKEIILYCVENNYKEILFITGKGIHSTNDKDVFKSKDLGKLKFSIPEYIKTDGEIAKSIMSIKEADIKDGGKGALLIKLKKL